MSFNLLFDGAGLLTFGHGCYYGVGAYTTALLMTEVGMSISTSGTLSQSIRS